MKSLVALEVCKDAIRAAEITAPLSNQPKISKIGDIDLPHGIAGESLVNDPDALAEHLKRLWEKEDFKTKQVAIVVSGRRFIVREHETIQTSLKTLRGIIRHEASDLIPDQMHDPIIDFFPTSSYETPSGLKTIGLMIATPADQIESLVGAVIRAGLEVEFVDFAPMAIARYINHSVDAPDGFAIANIREDSTDIVVAKYGIPRMIRVAPNGLKARKKKPGRRAVQEVSITSFSGSEFVEETPSAILAREISVTVAAQLDNLDIPVTRLYVTGQRANDEELIETFKNALDMEIVQLSESLAQEGEFSDELRSADFVAICAGMRGKS